MTRAQLVPYVRVVRESFPGDQSRSTTVSVTWLARKVTFSYNRPHTP